MSAFMNPQRAAHMAAPAPTDAAAPPMGGDDPNAGIGSAAAGYAGPENGPFECSNCTHFTAPNQCDNPQVQSDPEVNGQVEPEGCCNLFKPGAQEPEEEETQAIPGAGAGDQA
jgi:hypothetical protein